MECGEVSKCISMEEIEAKLGELIEYVKKYVKRGQRLVISKAFGNGEYVVFIYGWEEDEDEVL